MAITESQIKSAIEEYLNLEYSLKDYAIAKEEAVKRYHHLLETHPPDSDRYELHTASHVISAYDEAYKLKEKEEETHFKLNALEEKIKFYLNALKGRPLHIHFEFDGLDHRAGNYTFFLENDEVITNFAPVL